MKNPDIDFDKILEEVISSNPEFSRETLNESLEASIAGIILRLFLKNEIDESRINDLEYVWGLVIQNLDLLEEIPLIRQRFDDEFLESAKEAAEQGRISVAIILVATVIEHRLNVFYRDILEDYSGLSTNEATEAIRSNVSTKLGWLFHAITRDQISDDLARQIKQVFELRNAFVHFKSIMVPLGAADKAVELLKKVNEIGVENILNLPEKVTDELTEKAAKLMPAYQRAYELAEALVNMQPKDKKSSEA
jgi:hypothetical protein